MKDYAIIQATDLMLKTIPLFFVQAQYTEFHIRTLESIDSVYKINSKLLYSIVIKYYDSLENTWRIPKYDILLEVIKEIK